MGMQVPDGTAAAGFPALRQRRQLRALCRAAHGADQGRPCRRHPLAEPGELTGNEDCRSKGVGSLLACTCRSLSQLSTASRARSLGMCGAGIYAFALPSGGWAGLQMHAPEASIWQSGSLHAAVRLWQGDIKAAVAAHERALQCIVDAQHADTQPDTCMQAEVRLRQGDTKAAVGAYERALAEASAESASLLSGLARALISDGRASVSPFVWRCPHERSAHVSTCQLAACQ